MNHCSSCGARVVQRVPDGDNRERHVCATCGEIHYQNPKLVSGCVPAWDDRVLLCRRAIEPRYGYWTLPAGFMELGETLSDAAVRETWEEARAAVHVDALFAIVDVPGPGQVHVMYRGQLKAEKFAPGEESLEVALFQESEIPWDDLAFPSVRFTLERYFSDRSSGTFSVHTTSVGRWGPDKG